MPQAMKKSFRHYWPLLLLVLVSLASMRFYIREEPAQMERTEIAMCSSPATVITPDDNGKYIPALSGWGNFQYRISTKNDSAQFYFNQGLSFYYGYHFNEALASFKEAARFDSANAMIYWGQALAMGPYYNTYIYKMRPEVPVAVANMNLYATTVTEKEKVLIQIMNHRYSDDLTNADRQELNRSYAVALSNTLEKFPGDNTIRALYIDAVMLEHKWDFWDQHGQPKPWTPELVSLCEAGLKSDGNHPAFLHYYIHLVEASREPGRALPSANILKNNLPGIAHMVHMSSHMYQRNGLYVQGVNVNEDASAVNNRMDDKVPQLNIGKNKSIHFYAVQSYCAMTAGMDAKGTPFYERARERQLAMKPDFEKDPYAQFVYMIPAIANVRLGKWDAILNAPPPDSKWKLAVALDNFGRGLAHIHHKDLHAAKKCLAALDAVLPDSLLSVRLMPFNSPVQSCRVASAILRGQILYQEGKQKESIEAFTQAVSEEDQMIYREPHDWMIPARQYLGTYLLKVKKPVEAEKIFNEDLVANPGNGWSLLGLQQCMEAQKKNKEVAGYKLKVAKAFEAADSKPVAAVF
jgi:tetratricopeptide (TPR) repeat protein